ncbi:MAG: GNAT family N-acetyltransferase [Casimicrobiaceae bacterium]
MQLLAADGLVLEPQIATHADQMFAVLSDPAIYTYENEPPPSLDWLRARFARLETRHSADGAEQWLNWVIRPTGGRLAGYVQATVRADGHAHIAYVLCSTFWGRGIASRAVDAMIQELVLHYGVHTLWAVFKTPNFRSRRLLERMAFTDAPPAVLAQHTIEPDESLMYRHAVD